MVFKEHIFPFKDTIHDEEVSGDVRKFGEIVVEEWPEIYQVFTTNETSERHTEHESETKNSVVEEIDETIQNHEFEKNDNHTKEPDVTRKHIENLEGQQEILKFF